MPCKWCKTLLTFDVVFYLCFISLFFFLKSEDGVVIEFLEVSQPVILGANKPSNSASAVGMSRMPAFSFVRNWRGFILSLSPESGLKSFPGSLRSPLMRSGCCGGHNFCLQGLETGPYSVPALISFSEDQIDALGSKPCYVGFLLLLACKHSCVI